MTNKIPHEKIAAHLRVQLRAAFPGVQFTVRSEAFCRTVVVQWADGPSQSEVQAVTDPLLSSRGEITFTTRGQQHTGVSPVSTFLCTHFYNQDTRDRAAALWQASGPVQEVEDWNGAYKAMTVRGVAIRPGTAYYQINDIADLISAGRV